MIMAMTIRHYLKQSLWQTFPKAVHPSSVRGRMQLSQFPEEQKKIVNFLYEIWKIFYQSSKPLYVIIVGHLQPCKVSANIKSHAGSLSEVQHPTTRLEMFHHRRGILDVLIIKLNSNFRAKQAYYEEKETIIRKLYICFSYRTYSLHKCNVKFNIKHVRCYQDGW